MIPERSTTASAAILLAGKLLFFAVVASVVVPVGFALAVADGAITLARSR